MRLAGWTLTLAFFIVLPLRAQEPKKPEPKAEDKKPTVKTETIVGKVTLVESQKQTIKVEANPQTTRPNPAVVQAITAARASVRDVYKIRNAQERNAALKEIDDKIRDYQKNLYVYTVDAGSDNKVRLLNPKEMFDDTGNVKKLGPRERAQLMGKDKMFDGDWADIKMGQIVSVTYVAPPPPKKGKVEDLAPLEKNLESTKVMIVQDVPQQPMGRPKR